MTLPDLMTGSLTFVDLIVIGIVILSVSVGLIRGFTREILGTLGWIGAILVTFWTKDLAQEMLKHWIGNPLLANLISIIFIFVITLFVLLSITRVLSLKVRASVLGGLDRSLGVVFGIVRGSVICVVLFILINLYYKPHKRPSELVKSRSFSYLLQGTKILAGLFPKGTIPSSFYHPHPSSNKGEELPVISPTAQELMKNLAQPKASSGSEKQDSGYRDQNRHHMDRLFKNYSQDREE